MAEVAEPYLMKSCSVYFVSSIGNNNRLIFNELHGFGLFDGYLTICRLKRTQDEY